MPLMKIERISENQIRCTLSRSDLASHQVKISELAYGSEKAHDLFQDMMDQAFEECGFDATDNPLMIEAIPVSMDCIILMITKVDEPEEIDTGFSGFSNLEGFLSGDQDFPQIPEVSSNTFSKQIERIFRFESIDEVIALAHCTGSRLKKPSALVAPTRRRCSSMMRPAVA